MSLSSSEHIKPERGCDIAEPASLSDMLGALRQRSSGRWSAWATVFRQWGSVSWARAWVLGVGLILGVSLLAWGAWALLTFLGRSSVGWAGLALPDWTGIELISAVIGLGFLSAALFLIRFALWAGLEGPIRLWSLFSRGVSGQPSGHSAHCFAPWTPLSLWAVILFLPAVFAMGAIESAAQDPVGTGSGVGAIGFGSRGFFSNEQRGDQPVAETNTRLHAQLALAAQTQVARLVRGESTALSDEQIAVGERDVFWRLALKSWAQTMRGLINEKERLNDPAQILQKNNEALERGRARASAIAQEQTRLINGYWTTLGVDKEAPRLISLRLAGFRAAKSSEDSTSIPDAGKNLVFCLPMPEASLNEWMMRRSAFSAPARQALSSYFMTKARFSDISEPCLGDARNEFKFDGTLTNFGAFLKAGEVQEPDPDRPGETKTDFFYEVGPRARRLAESVGRGE